MSEKNDTVYIYVLQRISDKAYLYIGSSKNPQKRFESHRRQSFYLELQRAFLNNDVRFLVITSTDEKHRIEIESKLWKQFKDAGHPIVNRDPSLGYQKFPTRKGVALSQETKRKLSMSHKGLIRSEETRLKMSIAKKGHITRPEHRLKLSIAAKGHIVSTETKRKISEANKRRPPMKESTKAKIVAANKGSKRTDEVKAKMSIAQRKRRENERRQRESD